MQKAYSRINWQNEPSTETALGANNLNKVDKALDTIDDRVLSLYGYESRVAESEKNAKSSEINAKTSEENAKESELLAKQYADSAFLVTPEGYQKVLDDVESNKESIDSLEQSVNSKLESNGDISDTTVSFNSTDESNPTSYTDVPLLKSGEKSSSILSKISTMFKNMRYFLKILGNTDISKIGDGTATGAISSINDDLNNKIQVTDMPNAICEFRFPTNEAKTEYYALNVNASSMSYSFEGVNYRLPYWNFDAKLSHYYKVANSDGSIVGYDLGCHLSVKPILIIDNSHPSYFWLGMFYFEPDVKYLLNEISSNGLTAAANDYGTLSPSGGSGSYTFINLIPSNVLE